MKDNERVPAVKNALRTCITRCTDYVNSGIEGEADFATAESCKTICSESLSALNKGLTSEAAQTYVQRTSLPVGRGGVDYDEFSPKVNIDLSMLRFRLEDLDNKLNDKDLARWDLPSDQLTQ